MKKEIKLYESWKDITLGQMQDLEKISKDNPGASEFELSCLYISYLYSVDAKTIPFQEFQAYAKSLLFLGEPIPETKLQLDYNVNGINYKLDINPSAFTAGQFQDWSSYNLGEDKNLKNFLSVVMIPEGHKYCENYDIEKTKEDMLSLPMTTVNSIVSFFSALSLKYVDLLRFFLRRLLKKAKKKMDKNQYEDLEKQIETLFNNLESYPIS